MDASPNVFWNIFFIATCLSSFSNLSVRSKLIEGEILSPNYPNGYPSNPSSTWFRKISADNGRNEDNVFHFTVYTMDIPYGEKLFVRQGRDCGRSFYEIQTFDKKMDAAALPYTFFSTTNTVCFSLVRFYGGGRFKIGYKAFPKCGGKVTFPDGELISPNYPYEVKRKLYTCRWTLIASKGQIIQFHLLDIDIIANSRCSDDYLQLNGLNEGEYPSGSTKLCGTIDKQQKRTFQTVKNVVDVVYDNYVGWNIFDSERGFWMKYEVLGCKAEDLKTQGTPKPTLINGAQYYNYGYVATFKCPWGYKFSRGVKALSFVCLNSRKWNGNTDHCVEIICNDPGRPAHGSVTFTDGHKINSVARYSCMNSTTLVGERTRICSEDGVWNGTVPICKGAEVHECGDPGDPPNGFKANVTDSDKHSTSERSYPFGSVISYKCDVGYYLAVGGERTCQKNGTWSDEPPKCEVVTCPSNLASPINGTLRMPSTTEYGTLVTYSCDRGYELVNGNDARECRADGSWSGRAPICKKLLCGRPQKPRRGKFEIQDTIDTGTIAQYVCDIGYDLRGQNTTVCTMDGTWTNTAPICEAVECEDLTNKTYKHVTVQGYHGEKFGSTARFECDKGYYLDKELKKKSMVVICQADMLWSASVTECAYKAKEPDKEKQTDEGKSNIWMYVGIAVGGGALLIIIIVVATVAARRRAVPEHKGETFDNPMYNVTTDGDGQVVIGGGWSKNPTYKDAERAAQNRESNYDQPRNTCTSDDIYGNVSPAAGSLNRVPEVNAEED